LSSSPDREEKQKRCPQHAITIVFEFVRLPASGEFFLIPRFPLHYDSHATVAVNYNSLASVAVNSDSLVLVAGVILGRVAGLCRRSGWTSQPVKVGSDPKKYRLGCYR